MSLQSDDSIGIDTIMYAQSVTVLYLYVTTSFIRNSSNGNLKQDMRSYHNVIRDKRQVD